jgi:hypothetical protein
MATASELDWSEIGSTTGTIYASIMPWNDKKIGEILALKGSRLSGLQCDHADDEFLGRQLDLALQLLLFLSQKPIEYRPELIRAAKQEGKHRIKPALHKAHFVGQELYRPAPGVRKQYAASGKQIPAHWVKGHWKRVVHGPKRSQRRFQWICTYHTFGPDEPAT